MKNNVTGLNQKFYSVMWTVPVVVLISLFLPFMYVKEDGISVSVIGGVFQALNFSLETGKYLYALLGIVIVAIPTILILAAYLLAFFKPAKSTVKLAVGASIVQAVMATIILFSMAKIINGTGELTTKFLVRYCGVGYWLYLVIAFVGLVIAMKAVKINPGYIVLVIMSIIWLFPIAWVILISFRDEPGSYTSYFWPKVLTLKNYRVLLMDSSQFPFVRWFFNTLKVALCSCVLTSFIVLSTAFTLSRIRFEGRRLFMNILLILGMFPGFMSMIAVYYILKGLGFTQSLASLVMVYAGAGAMSYYIAKGFFDTIPKALDEAAWIDGATKWQLFTKITIPLSKPILIYTVLISFVAPWADYIFAKIIMGDNYQNYTVALGLFLMLDKANIDTWYTRFAAGAVLISIPIAILFITLQKYYVEGLSGSVKG